MQAKPTTAGITLKLTVNEALHLAALLGQMTSLESAGFPFYDDLADALEQRTEREIGEGYEAQIIFDTIREQLEESGIGHKVEGQMQSYRQRIDKGYVIS